MKRMKTLILVSVMLLTACGGKLADNGSEFQDGNSPECQVDAGPDMAKTCREACTWSQQSRGTDNAAFDHCMSECQCGEVGTAL